MADMAPAIQAHLEPFQPYQPWIDLTFDHGAEGAGPSFQGAIQRDRKKDARYTCKGKRWATV